MSTQNIKEQLQALKSNYQKLAKDLFLTGTKELFDKYEALDSFGFTAYSPYFNDGESCEFSARTDIPYINGYHEYDEGDERCDSFEAREGDVYIWDKINRSEYSSTERKWVEVAGDEKLSAMVGDVVEFLSSFDDDDVWEEMVGNHVIVQFTREGLQIEEYSNHD